MTDSPVTKPRRFTVALSFPGEKREFIREVADTLAAELGKNRVLYDDYITPELARPNLDLYLGRLYREESELLVPFYCADYERKKWCRLEWRQMRDILFQVEEERIMPFRFDDAPISGVLSIDGYIKIGDRTPQDVADLILERLKPELLRYEEESSKSRDLKADISRIIKYAPAELIGREDDLKLLDDAWDKVVRGEHERPRVLTFVALGGEGKTSLVAKWAADLAHHDWPGCEAAFAWSFYSQGTSEKTQASSDSFLKEALLFFGDAEMANSAAGSFDKGRRLAQLIGRRRALLILDGLEPLQYAPTSPTGSELKDHGVSALLKALATNNNGLCVVTTRYSVPDLRNFWQTTAPEIKLTSLSNDAGVALLGKLGVRGTEKEFEQLVSDVKGHALTLNLLGSFLRDAHGGDIRKRGLVKLEEADVEEQSGHAFHVMDAYVKSFKDEGEKGTRALSILRLLGLFDRPASADCLNALWTGEEIGGLTGPLIRITEAQRNVTLRRLEDANLITVNRQKGSEELVSLDAHPLLREYFAKRVREELSGAWRAAHRRIYEHLCASTKEGDQPTLEELQPLYQAVAHGCHAGLQQEALNNVLVARIQRGADRAGFYSTKKLGAYGSDLGCISSFFESPWNSISRALTDAEQSFLLNQAALRLRALGRLSEALEPMRFSCDMDVKVMEWDGAALSYNNLSELELTLGEVAAALSSADQSVFYSDRCGEWGNRMVTRTTHADALHQTGRRAEAEARFREAEHLQAEHQRPYPLLYSVQGFQYCEIFLAEAERAAWRPRNQSGIRVQEADLVNACRIVSERAAQTLKWMMAARGASLLAITLDHLTLGRATLYAAILGKSEIRNSESEIESAVSGLRRAAHNEFIVRGLLTRAWLRFLTGAHTGPESAQEDLDEAWEIAERGPMRLHMADIHLYRARLFHDVKPYPWAKNPDGTERGPKDDLKDARKLIEKCGYWRRKEELEDAEEAAKNWH